MVELKDLKLRPPKILLMGTFGTGKTALSTTLGRHAVVIDLDDGLRTALTMKDKFTKDRGLVDVKVCWGQDPKKAMEFDKARSFVNGISDECRGGRFKRRALIIDGYSGLADSAVRTVMASSGDLEATPQLQPYVKFENLLYVVKSLPLVVIVIAHLRRVDIGESSIFELQTPGKKLPQKIPTFFDEVWNAKIRGQEYVIQTRGTSAMPCRTRAGLQDLTKQNLGMVEILRMIGHDIEEDPSDTKEKTRAEEKTKEKKV